MTKDMLEQDREILFCQNLVENYFKYGSVEKMFTASEYGFPISYSHTHRVLKEWGVIKAVGRSHTQLSELILFMDKLAHENIPLEALYKKMPHDFQISLSTLHRVLHYIKEGVTRRVGTALVVSLEDNPYRVLIGRDVSTPRIELGKPFGSLSMPMGFSVNGEDNKMSVLRVMQQEMFTKKVIARNFPYDIVESQLPFMHIDIADVRVGVYRLILPKEYQDLGKFSSYKLKGFRFIDLSDIADNKGNLNFRSGIREIAESYLRSERGEVFKLPELSLLNKNLTQLAFDYSV